MVELSAKKSFTYARRALRVGERFAAHDGDVRILLAIGHAVRPETAAAAPPPPADPDPSDEDPPAGTAKDRIRRVVSKRLPTRSR